LLLPALLLAVVATTACARSTGGAVTTAPLPAPAGADAPPAAAATVVAPRVVGAPDARAAIDGFLKAVRAQDIQAMSVLWGTAKGPARDQFKRDELEKRLIVIQCYLNHDRWSYAEDRARLSAGGRQEYLIELRQQSLGARTIFTTIAGPGGRWFVEIIDVQPLKDFCR
jgi:hypothetical protein